MADEHLTRGESEILRHAADFDEILDESPAVVALVEKGLLRPGFQDHNAAGYVITLDGADVVQGYGRYRLV
jgi:hypothetical protein